MEAHLVGCRKRYNDISIAKEQETKLKNHKCKECGHEISGRQGLDKVLSGGDDKEGPKLSGDDDMNMGLLDELQNSMGSGMDGAIKIIIESRGK